MKETNKTMYYTSKTSVHKVTDITPVTERIFQGNMLTYGDRVIKRYFAKSSLYTNVDEAFSNYKNKRKY